MKTKSSKTRSNGAHSVHLEIFQPNAHKVLVAGSFNDWHPDESPMVDLGNGRWGRELSLAPGRYEYLFVVDGCWIADPAAKDFVPNPYGGFNSTLVVPSAEKRL